MTTLPFSEEIRFARQQSEEAAAATALLHQVQATLQSLAIIQRQHTDNTAIQPEIPGEHLLSDVITRWPALAALPPGEDAEQAGGRGLCHQRLLHPQG